VIAGLRDGRISSETASPGFTAGIHQPPPFDKLPRQAPTARRAGQALRGCVRPSPERPEGSATSLRRRPASFFRFLLQARRIAARSICCFPPSSPKPTMQGRNAPCPRDSNASNLWAGTPVPKNASLSLTFEPGEDLSIRADDIGRQRLLTQPLPGRQLPVKHLHFFCTQSDRSRRGFSSRKAAPRGA
jgi:hypothetical protein